MAGFLSPSDWEQTFDSQLEKVHSLFRRQLAIPLYGKRNCPVSSRRFGRVMIRPFPASHLRQTWLAFVSFWTMSLLTRQQWVKVYLGLLTLRRVVRLGWDSQFPMLRCGAWVGRDRVSERTRKLTPCIFWGNKSSVISIFLQKKPPLQNRLWRWFGSAGTVDWSSSVEFWGWERFFVVWT